MKFINKLVLKLIVLRELIFNDMLGLASIISVCDLVITCSNVNAHMAGALNKNLFAFAAWQRKIMELGFYRR